MLTRFATLSIILMTFHSTLAFGSGTQPDLNLKAHHLLDAWRPRLDAMKFEYLIASPFIIAGDGGATRLAEYRDGTILAAARALRHMYIDSDLDEPVLILLVESDKPYRHVAKEWFKEADPPHFGFYRPGDRVMLMNVSTGTGTLVHELTHALIAKDFPGLPNWFNEGFASLFEQCSLADGIIRGLENWRLPALQAAIRDGTLRPLRELIADGDFYGKEHVGLNYAQARYLMFYLQEKGLLAKYYREFRDHVKVDPTGITTLERMVGPGKLVGFDRDWKAWVIGLRFGR